MAFGSYYAEDLITQISLFFIDLHLVIFCLISFSQLLLWIINSLQEQAYIQQLKSMNDSASTASYTTNVEREINNILGKGLLEV